MRPLPLAALFAAAALPALAEQPIDPDWPCVQRKVPELSIGQMWSAPLPTGDWSDNRAVTGIAAQIAPRRVSEDEVKALASDFAATLPPGDRAEVLGEVFAAVLHQVNLERSEVISGIARYSHSQIQMAERIAAREKTIADLEKLPEADRDIDKYEEEQDALKWDTRVYRDRAQSLSYVCETPVLLEQRAFAIARTLQALVEP